MPEEKPTIGPGFKFPVIYEITRQVEYGEKIPAIDGTMTDVSNLRGDKFWSKPTTGGKEIMVCFDSWQKNRWLDQNAALVRLIQALPPYA
jgi:hypothetical protein